jgi:hypothetical protein
MLRISDKPYEFRHYPPNHGPQDVYGGHAPNRPFANAAPEESSVYYYWWRFLKLNPVYIRECEYENRGIGSLLYRDFGDIRNIDFFDWWESRGCEL